MSTAEVTESPTVEVLFPESRAVATPTVLEVALREEVEWLDEVLSLLDDAIGEHRGFTFPDPAGLGAPTHPRNFEEWSEARRWTVLHERFDMLRIMRHRLAGRMSAPPVAPENVRRWL